MTDTTARGIRQTPPRPEPIGDFVRRPFPSVDEVEFQELFTLEEIPVMTEDGWQLVLTRYKPRSQPYPQPLYGVPLLLVHGYTQNRRAWSSGDFVKSMLYFGTDLFLLELRGHGKSSLAAQRRRARRTGDAPPDDLDYAWDLDSYLLQDLPAAVAEIKRVTRREKIFYCGHSLGGVLGYAYATLFDDLLGLATIGAPSDLARTAPWLRALAWLPLLGFPAVDVGLAGLNLARVLGRAGARLVGYEVERGDFRAYRFNRIPFRAAFRWLERKLPRGNTTPVSGRLPLGPLLYQPGKVGLRALRPLLREGGNDEPRATAEQFARWIRRGELVSYRVRHDVAAAFPRIRIPVAIFFGDEDPLATVRSTRSVYRSVSSDYLLWRPVRGNSHLDLTMGHDIRQICYDVKNLMTYALDHDGERPSLPRGERTARA